MWTSMIIAVLVLWSCKVVWKSVAPTSFYQISNYMADGCAAYGWQRLANYLRPKAVTGCGGGCGCEQTQPQSQPPSQDSAVQAVKWK